MRSTPGLTLLAAAVSLAAAGAARAAPEGPLDAWRAACEGALQRAVARRSPDVAARVAADPEVFARMCRRLDAPDLAATEVVHVTLEVALGRLQATVGLRRARDGLVDTFVLAPEFAGPAISVLERYSAYDGLRVEGLDADRVRHALRSFQRAKPRAQLCAGGPPACKLTPTTVGVTRPGCPAGTELVVSGGIEHGPMAKSAPKRRVSAFVACLTGGGQLLAAEASAAMRVRLRE